MDMMRTANDVVIGKINEALESSPKSKDLIIKIILVFLELRGDARYSDLYGWINDAMVEKALVDSDMSESVHCLNSLINHCYLFPDLSVREAGNIREYVNQLAPVSEGTFRKYMEDYFKAKSELVCVDHMTQGQWATDYILNWNSESVFKLRIEGVEDYGELYESILDSIGIYYGEKGFNFTESDVDGGGMGYGRINLRGVRRSESEGNEVRCIDVRYTNKAVMVTIRKY